MLGVIQDRMSIFIVLRLERNGSLTDFLNRHRSPLPLDVARNITVDIILGLTFLHNRNIIHGDLKPDNILLDENFRGIIGDFGLSLMNKSGEHCEYFGEWGTPTFQAPEQLIEKCVWDHRVDYFVVGLILAIMISLTHPFGSTTEEIESNTKAISYKLPDVPSRSAKSFFEKT